MLHLLEQIGRMALEGADRVAIVLRLLDCVRNVDRVFGMKALPERAVLFDRLSDELEQDVLVLGLRPEEPSLRDAPGGRGAL